ncbi:Eukaryotic translation initiation factor 3 subunit G [Trichoplax sp. H2]|nr:Eukaryotic translation initiation factor 3 subunit G [Trichoplax sp. H2]|eukprot:RDD45375.1 Eukaryotic translation initiation factor 3 subunit G [Trichoplax sp. H2]
MPIMDNDMVDSNATWGERMENEDDESSSPKVEILDNGIKIVEEERTEGNRKFLVKRTFRIENKRVPKPVAERKAWKKFGASTEDPKGPSSSTTKVAEDTFLAFITNREDNSDEKSLNNIPKERFGTYKAPFAANKENARSELSRMASSQLGVDSKYVVPSRRFGGSQLGDTLELYKRDDQNTVRVSNLSEDADEADLTDLFRHFGQISRVFLVRDKKTRRSKCFAFINYKNREDAAYAISQLNGFAYDHLLLDVEWAKPPSN